MSAYALFFRDTQATIKEHNPSASFGEVSKVVASMWDQLDPEHKDVGLRLYVLVCVGLYVLGCMSWVVCVGSYVLDFMIDGCRMGCVVL